MAIPTIAERVATSFAAWERRGRGWDVAGYPVALEPPYRPFGLLPLPELAHRHIDDGKRPTALSRFADWVVTQFTGGEAAPAPPEAFEEEAPFPTYACESIATRHVLLPHDFRADSRVMAQLLPVLAGGYHPFALEIIGHDGRVYVQVACGTPDAERLFGAVADFIPGAALVDAGDLLVRYWQHDTRSLVVDFGYAEEFLLPLPGIRSFSVDPYASLVSACARAGANETLCFQVLVEKTINPWHQAIREAVTAPDGKPLFIDAPEFVGAAKEKTGGGFLFAAVVRVGAAGVNEYRLLDLVRGTAAFFGQFSRPGVNQLMPLENEGYPDDRHEAAFLDRASLRTGMILSGDELLPLLHFPDETVRNEALVRSDQRTKPLPESARRPGTILGENEHRGIRETVSLGVAERLQHTVIVGATGTGKSTLLVNTIRQDLERGDGVAVLDPHGDLIDEVLGSVPKERIADVVLFDPSDEAWPIGFNVLRAEGELEQSVLASDLVGMFQRLSTSWGDGMSTVLANAVLAILAHPEGGTLLHLRRFLVEDVYRKQFLSKVVDPDVQFFWSKEWPLIGARSIGPILTRLNAFLRPKVIRRIVGQRRPKLDIGAVMKGRKIFLGKLAQGLIGNENAYLLGSLLLSTFLQQALSRQRLSRDERLPFWLYLDEAEHFVTLSVASLLTEARKYGVGLHMAFQMLAQLKGMPEVESAVMGSAHTRIAFRVGDDDARRLDAGFSFFTAEDLQSLGPGEAIVRLGEARQDFNLRTFKAPAVPAVEARGRREAIIDLSRAQFAVSLEQLTQEWDELRDTAAQSASEVPQPSPQIPAFEPKPAPASSRVEMPLPTRAAPVRPKEERPTPVLGRGGPEHKYLQHLIQRLAEERGFRAVIEEQVEGGQVDVALRRGKVSIACEVSVTTDAAHELENATKCARAGFAHVWLVVADKKRKEKLTSALSERGAGFPAQCLLAEDLVGALDAIAPETSVREKVVGGYKVRVTRKASSAGDQERRESAIAEVIARSIVKQKRSPGASG